MRNEAHTAGLRTMKRSILASSNIHAKAEPGRHAVNASPPPGSRGVLTSYQTGRGYSSVTDNEQSSASDGGVADAGPLELAISPLGPPAVPLATSSPLCTVPSERLLACHRYSRAIRVLAVLDAVVVLYGASAFTPLILMLWGPIAGYVSSTFRLRATYAFLFYYSLRVSWDMGWLLSGGITWVVVWVFLVTDAAALGLVYLYLTLLRKCTPVEVEQLRDPHTSWASAFFPLTVPGTPSSSAS